MQKGAGVLAHFPDAVYVDKGATLRSGAREALASADLVAKVQAPTPQEVELLAEGATVVSFLQPSAQLDTVRALVERKATAFSLDLVPRISRAQSMDALVVAGDGVGLPVGPGSRRTPPQVLPHVHDRGRHHPARQGARARCRSCRPAGHRHRPSSRCPGARLRRAGRGQGRGAIARCQLRRARARVPGGRGRVRPCAVRGIPRPSAGPDQQRGGGVGRGDHNRGRPGPPCADPGDHGHGRAHGRGVGHRRHGGGQRWELRVVGAWPGPRAPRRGGVRALQPSLGDAHPRELPVLAERGQLPGADRRRWRTAPRLRRRDRGGQLRRACRRGRPWADGRRARRRRRTRQPAPVSPAPASPVSKEAAPEPAPKETTP